jgi:hypothetical protein
MILRAIVDKVRNMFGQTPVVDLQPEPIKTIGIVLGDEYELSLFSSKVIEQPKKIKLYNVYLHHRKAKSQKKNWKKYKGQRAAK